MKIGIFGGSFDPVHNGHIKIAEYALSHVDKVVFVPSGVSPHKDKNFASPKDRFEMVRLAIAGFPLFEVSDYEILKNSASYSFETVQHFKELHPNDELFFIIGDDAYNQIHSWKNPDILLSSCKFLVYKRTGEKINLPHDVIDIEPIPISSTMIREFIKSGNNFSDLVPSEVFEYILQKNLYNFERT